MSSGRWRGCTISSPGAAARFPEQGSEPAGTPPPRPPGPRPWPQAHPHLGIEASRARSPSLLSLSPAGIAHPGRALCAPPPGTPSSGPWRASPSLPGAPHQACSRPPRVLCLLDPGLSSLTPASCPSSFPISHLPCYWAPLGRQGQLLWGWGDLRRPYLRRPDGCAPLRPRPAARRPGTGVICLCPARAGVCPATMPTERACGRQSKCPPPPARGPVPRQPGARLGSGCWSPPWATGLPGSCSQGPAGPGPSLLRLARAMASPSPAQRSGPPNVGPPTCGSSKMWVAPRFRAETGCRAGVGFA